MNAQTVFGIDVGTGSARAGLFEINGNRLAAYSHPIQMWRPRADFAEQSSEDIWRAIAICTRECLAQAQVNPADVAGISFDATCSLVVVGENGEGLPVNIENDSQRDIIVWMDHRALGEADEINAGNYQVLKYVGGKISPEMQTPKLLWLKRNLPDTWQKTAQFFDLPDYLTWRASGSLSRSHCTVVCKWTFLGHENRWDENYFQSLGIEDALPRIGDQVQAMGTKLGSLTPQAADDLGLTTNCIVGQGIIDAHAGGLGILGAVWQDGEIELEKLETTLALIGGTSNCHMAVSREAKFVEGVWGPYFGAMIPGLWLQEGGQSTAGAAIDFVIQDHAAYPELKSDAEASSKTVYELLNAELLKMGDSPTLSREFHVLPYFLGNRSPHADPHARAIYDGVSLDSSRQNLAIRYLATVQAVAYGTRDIIETLNGNGYRIDSIIVTGGGIKNPLWLQEHADATGLTLILPKESEAVLLGSAVLAATASGLYPDIYEAMQSMSKTGRMITPRSEFKPYHDAKFQIFKQMYQQQQEKRKMMSGF